MSIICKILGHERTQHRRGYSIYRWDCRRCGKVEIFAPEMIKTHFLVLLDKLRLNE